MSDAHRTFVAAASTLGSGESVRDMITGLVDTARVTTHAGGATLRCFARPRARPFVLSVGETEPATVAPYVALLEAEARPSRVPVLAQAPSFLGVPLQLRAETIGCLYVFAADGAGFTDDDERLLELFGAQAAFAVGLLRRTEATRERGRFFEALVTQSPDAMMFFEAPLVLSYVNAATARMWGDRPGPPAPGPLPPERVPLHRNGTRFTFDELPQVRAMRGETVERIEVDAPVPNGERFKALTSAAPVYSDSGELLGAVMTVRDVSAEVELERLRAEFVAIMVHDLRNPLNALMLSAESLLTRADGEQVMASVHVLRRIDQLSRRVAFLAAELLDASRVELGRLSLLPERVDLPSAVAHLVDDIAPVLAGHSVEIQVHGQPAPVFVDPLRLVQILSNLLENSAKYSLPGAPILVLVQEADDGTVITVVDRGPGISAEDLPRLFDRFFQSQRAREKRQTGLGLGLYITKGLVDASSGWISVESTPGQGSRFRVFLPRPPRELDQRATESHPTH